MFSGFDYGTSNCAVGVLKNNTCDTVELLPIDNGKTFMPSALYALERELVCESVAKNIHDKNLQQDFITLRRSNLTKASQVRNEYAIQHDEQSIFLGGEAFNHYIHDPDEGYFVKSPKSFLGASGLKPASVHFFEDIVTAMMQGIKQRADKQLDAEIEHTVIGRPVNFQGLDAEQSNRQAIDILTTSAKRAGFKSVEFLYEPLAAGMDFETRLAEDKTVLVVDIGGGTTDCSVVRMGPSRCKNFDRSADFLGHSGERIGGNDLDIQIAAKGLMPLFGMESILKNGLRMPTQNHWNAVKVNDLSAQTQFNQLQTELHLQQLLLDTREPKLLQRLINLRENKQNYHLVRSAEEGKIALSDADSYSVDLSYIEPQLNCEINRSLISSAIERPLDKILHLMQEAINQSESTPELIYITGGSAKSPIVRSAIQSCLGDIPVIDGDHFGSVATGLTVWAKKIFS